MAVEPAAPICCKLEKLVERGVVTAAGLFGAGGIGVDYAAIIVIIVVSFFDSCETAHLEALDGFDVHRGLDAAAEVVALAVRLLLVHIFHGIHESGFLGTPEIAVRGSFVVDRIGRVQQGRILEVAAEIIVAVAHVAEVVLEVQPTVEGLLAGGQLCHQFVAVGGLRDTFCILVVDGCAVVEFAGRTHYCNVMVVCNSCGAAHFRHPVGVVALAVGAGVDVGCGQSAGKGGKVPELPGSRHSGARVAHGCGSVS